MASRMRGVAFNFPRLAFAGAAGMMIGGGGGFVLYFGSPRAAAAVDPATQVSPQFLGSLYTSMAVTALLVFVAVELLLPQGARLRPVVAARSAGSARLRVGGALGRADP